MPGLPPALPPAPTESQALRAVSSLLGLFAAFDPETESDQVVLELWAALGFARQETATLFGEVEALLSAWVGGHGEVPIGNGEVLAYAPGSPSYKCSDVAQVVERILDPFDLDDMLRRELASELRGYLAANPFKAAATLKGVDGTKTLFDRKPGAMKLRTLKEKR